MNLIIGLCCVVFDNEYTRMAIGFRLIGAAGHLLKSYSSNRFSIVGHSNEHYQWTMATSHVNVRLKGKDPLCRIDLFVQTYTSIHCLTNAAQPAHNNFSGTAQTSL